MIGYIVPLDYALKDYNFLYYTISNLQVFCFPLSFSVFLFPSVLVLDVQMEVSQTSPF